MWRWLLGAFLIVGVQAAAGDDGYPVGPPAGPALSAVGEEPSFASSPYESAWPRQDVPTGDSRTPIAAPQSTPSTAEAGCSATVFPTPDLNRAAADRAIESTWYFREDAFSWNERLDGTDFVKEYGPLSTLGYLRRNGVERFRFELFGSTVAYDGGAMYDDGSIEPYHQSNGTDYLGLRGEYDFLIEPSCWSRLRLVVGLGTRFWIRDLKNAVTPSGTPVIGYQEAWWTFYPYLGLETNESSEPGPKLFASARIGATPLTYQHATYFDSVVWPRCGITGRVEVGVRFEHFSLSTVAEAMTWSESALVQGPYGDETLQPASRMLTIGGQIGYTF